jgi:predicted Zn-dependent peptidase
MRFKLPQHKIQRICPGLSLIVETHPDALSSSVGLFFAMGSRHEPDELAGVCHLIEHFLFKGTTHFTADEISRSVERHGGEINAYTDRELTCFHATMPHDKWGIALQTLFEMIFDARLDPEEFDKEREVVIQELKGYEDSAEDEFWDSFYEYSFAGSRVGRRIAGRAQDITKLSYEKVTRFFSKNFLTVEKYIVVVSPFDFSTIQEKVKELFSRRSKYLWGDALGRRPTTQNLFRNKTSARKNLKIPSIDQSRLQKFESDQAFFGFSFPGVSIRDPQEVVYSMVSTLLGGGSSSKLYLAIRETHGLAYTAGAFLNSHSDVGLISGFCTTDPKNIKSAVELSAKVCKSLARGISKDDFEFIKDLSKGSLYLGFEGVASRMESLGRQEILLGRIMEIEDSLKDIEQLSMNSLNRALVPLAKDPFLYAFGNLPRMKLSELKNIWRRA